jgi:transposase
MHEIPPIITERVDDIPLLLQPMQRRGLPRLFDDHFPPHGNWTGLSLGWVSPSWLSSIVARGDHRMVHVEPWGAKRLGRLGATTGQAVPPVDGTDARLESVLRRWRDDERWSAFAAALHQHTVRGYALSTARVQVERTRASASATGTEGGLLPCGHSKEYRPDLPQVNVRQAVLEPLGMPLATAVVAGERAADPLSLPGSKRGQARLGRHGLFYGGDGTMASRATRACMAASGDFSLGPRPQGHRTEGECDAALAAVGCGAQPLTPVVRAHPPGEPELSAEGDAYGVAMSQKRDDQMHNWTARRWVVRSVRPAHAASIRNTVRPGNAGQLGLEDARPS